MPKRIVPLSDIQISKAKSKEQDYKLTDGYGLFLLVTPSGGKLWRFDYRFEGKRKTLTFGPYPVLSLADARQRREHARKLLTNGQDPGAIKKMQKAAAEEQATIAATTFERVAREWHEHKRPEWSENHAGRLLKRLEQDIFPFIGASH